MPFTIERDKHSAGRIVIAMFDESAAYRFFLSLETATLAQPRGHELLAAWALGIATIPGAGVTLKDTEALLDIIDILYPADNHARRGLHRPKCRSW